jgi:4-aminobutyrate aminotransferase-like enzyme
MTKLRTLQEHHSLMRTPRPGPDDRRELVKDEKLTPAPTEAEAIRDALLRNDVLVGVGGIYGNVIRFQPPLIITRGQIDQAIDAFAVALQEVAQPAPV